MNIIKEIMNKAREYFSEGGTHGWDHTVRVERLCLHIGEVEKANLFVLSAAAYLHDIGRKAEEVSRGRLDHAVYGAEIAQPILEAYPTIPGPDKENILHCIRTHRFRKNNQPETIEAKVLYDADKIDAIGAVGIGRAFMFAGKVDAVLHDPYVNPDLSKPYSSEDTAYREYVVKLSRITDRMLTKEGRKIAVGRDMYMKEFFKRLNYEVTGHV